MPPLLGPATAAPRQYISLVISLIFVSFIWYTVLYAAKENRGWFRYHPTSMSLAFGLLIPQAVFIMGRYGPFGSVRLSQRWNIHMLINSTAYAVALFGAFAIFMHKVGFFKQHLATWHAVSGFLTLIFTTIQVCAGFAIYHEFLPKSMHPIHVISGLSVLLMAGITIMLVGLTKWAQSTFIPVILAAGGLVPIVMFLEALLQVYQRGWFGRAYRLMTGQPTRVGDFDRSDEQSLPARVAESRAK